MLRLPFLRGRLELAFGRHEEVARHPSCLPGVEGMALFIIAPHAGERGRGGYGSSHVRPPLITPSTSLHRHHVALSVLPRPDDKGRYRNNCNGFFSQSVALDNPWIQA